MKGIFVLNVLDLGRLPKFSLKMMVRNAERKDVGINIDLNHIKVMDFHRNYIRFQFPICSLS